MIISVDSETTGLDIHHGAKPFFVTIAKEDESQLYWEWHVDPLTREPHIPPEDIEHIQSELDSADKLILQNAKFDVAMLTAIGVRNWRWDVTEDTLIAGHLLASNQPHNLTDMATHYLKVRIQHFEDALEKCVKEARRKVQQAKLRERRAKIGKGKAGKETGLDNWAIAEAGRFDMPSAKAESWKFDMWLPATMALEQVLLHPDEDCTHLWREDNLCTRCGGHLYWTVLRDYSNTDSSVTLALWEEMERRIRERKLEAIYRERMKVLPIAVEMESRGITISGERLETLYADYAAKSEELGAQCKEIAAKRGYDLTLPRTGNNKSLIEFCFGALGLPALKRSPKTGTPSLDKQVVEEYIATLPPGDQLDFIKALKDKRARDTGISYMSGYVKFWFPWVPISSELSRVSHEVEETVAGWYVLHPSLNPCGTDTLRWSSSNPNEQNISKREGFNLRYCFGPAPGREWWSLDAKNIELRLPAYRAPEPEMIALFEEPDKPPYYGSNHLLNFHTVYLDLWESELGKVCEDPKCCDGKVVDITRVGPHCKKKYASTWYQWCKNGGFAKLYGAQRPKVDGTFHKMGANDLLDARFKGMAALNQRTIAFARKYGYVETFPDKTVDPDRGYPILCTRTEDGSVLPTVPLNYMVQGSAMWWTMKAMNRVAPLLASWRRHSGSPFDGWLAMQVHDEIVLDFPKRAHPKRNPKASNLGRIREIVKLMEEGGRDFTPAIPTPVGIEYHESNWGEGVTL